MRCEQQRLDRREGQMYHLQAKSKGGAEPARHIQGSRGHWLELQGQEGGCV